MKQKLLKEQSVEEISTHLVSYLKTYVSDYFEYDPKEKREEPILHVFDKSDEYLKNKLCRAVALAISRERSLRSGVELFLRLMKLAKEMRVEQANRILANFAAQRTYSNVTSEEEKILKETAIATLFDIYIPDDLMKTVIEQNVTDPRYAGICLAATSRMSDKINTFIGYLPQVLEIYEVHPKEIKLPNILRSFLINSGEGFWAQRGKDVLLCTETKTTSILRVLERAYLEPSIRRLDTNEEIFAVNLLWPGKNNLIVSSEPFIPTGIQRDGLFEYMSQRLREPESSELDKFIHQDYQFYSFDPDSIVFEEVRNRTATWL